MNGTSGSTFSPNATTTRGMLVTILWRMDGSPIPIKIKNNPGILGMTLTVYYD